MDFSPKPRILSLPTIIKDPALGFQLIQWRIIGMVHTRLDQILEEDLVACEGFLSQLMREVFCKYFLMTTQCHILSWFNNLHIVFVFKALLKIWRFRKPQPPTFSVWIKFPTCKGDSTGIQNDHSIGNGT